MYVLPYCFVLLLFQDSMLLEAVGCWKWDACTRSQYRCMTRRTMGCSWQRCVSCVGGWVRVMMQVAGEWVGGKGVHEWVCDSMEVRGMCAVIVYSTCTHLIVSEIYGWLDVIVTIVSSIPTKWTHYNFTNILTTILWPSSVYTNPSYRTTHLKY